MDIQMDLQSENINEIAQALAIAQESIGTAPLDKVNPHFKSQYASYDSIRKTCQKPLSENGLCITQMIVMTEKGRVLITQVSHKSGQWIRSELGLPAPDRETPQAVGSSITYAKRYALASLLCIGTGEDDDGERAEKEYTQSKPSEPEEVIGEEEAGKIEAMLDGYQELRNNMLNYYSGANKSIKSYALIPKSKLNEIYRNIKSATKNP